MIFSLLRIDAEDRQPFAWSAGWFATVLSAFYIVRPVREALGSMEGAERLKYFFLYVFLTMLVAVPIYAWVVSRFERRHLVPVVYRFLGLNLLGFSFAMRLPDSIVAQYVAPVFFVWVSVYVMFLTSLFWSVQADVFSRERGKKLFGRISACGTAAAIVSSLMMGQTAALVGPANMLLVSAALMEGGLYFFRQLDLSHVPWTASPNDGQRSANPFQGFIQVVSNPYLSMILLYTFATTLCSTCLYLQQADLLKAHWPDSAERAGVFAQIDFAVLVLAGLFQLLVATPLIRYSVAAALCALPAVFAVGFGSLSVDSAVTIPELEPATSTLQILVRTVILSRACIYGLSVPAIGVLYTVVSRDAKYKAKSIIDTLVIRGGDAFTGWTVSELLAAGMALPVLLGSMVPIAGGTMGLAVLLGRANARHQLTQTDSTDSSDEG